MNGCTMLGTLAVSFQQAWPAQFLTLQKGGHIMVLEEVIITLLAAIDSVKLVSQHSVLPVVVHASATIVAGWVELYLPRVCAGFKKFQGTLFMKFTSWL